MAFGEPAARSLGIPRPRPSKAVFNRAPVGTGRREGQAHGPLVTSRALQALLATYLVWGKKNTHRIRGACCEGCFTVGSAARPSPWHLNPLKRPRDCATSGHQASCRQPCRPRLSWPGPASGEREGPGISQVSRQSLEIPSPELVNPAAGSCRLEMVLQKVSVSVSLK